MKPVWVLAPALVLLQGCAGLDPAATREASRKLVFTLERVDPSLELAFPLEQSRLKLRVVLDAENPTKVRFQARTISGGISLDSTGALRPVGRLSLDHGVDLKPFAHTPVQVDLSFSYQDLQDAWAPLRAVALGTGAGTWHLDGQVGLDVLGIPVTLPLKVEKRVGAP